MGFFSKQFASVIEWNESKEGTLFWKFDNDEIKNRIPELEEAALKKKLEAEAAGEEVVEDEVEDNGDDEDEGEDD